MYERKINFVCTVCSQTFTRKSGAKRHSDTIHAGTAFFVRLIDYIVGRIEGRYQPSDPRSYRHEKKDERRAKNLLSLENCKNAFSANEVPASRFTTLLDETIKNPYYGIDVIEHSKSNFNKKTANTMFGDSDESRPNGVLRSNGGLNEIEGTKQYENNPSPTTPQFQEWAPKYLEFTKLVNKLYSKANAEIILSIATFHYLNRRDDLVGLDEKLAFLRNIDENMYGFPS
jgi:hypothetical protein